MKGISILGSTGSIGRQTLDVVRCDPNLRVVGLSAHQNCALMEAQIREFHPVVAAISSEEAAAELRVRVADTATQVLAGMEGVCAVAAAEGADMVVTAIVGIAGLVPTLAAIDAGRDIALANKETLVTAGELVMPRIREKGVALVPVDSEHSAIFQCLHGQERFVDELWITASGGPFFGKTRAELEPMTAEQALRHPNWSMGAKITIDSATLVNKGLEMIEARHLFDVPMNRIRPVVHRQSIVHSLVKFCDGSVLAQMGLPDMRHPISYALHYPDRAMPQGDALDLCKVGSLTFAPIDESVFGAVALARRAAEIGGTMPTVLNSANEEAVAAFLHGECGFLAITDMIGEAMTQHTAVSSPTLDDILETDAWARRTVRTCLKRGC